MPSSTLRPKSHCLWAGVEWKEGEKKEVGPQGRHQARLEETQFPSWLCPGWTSQERGPAASLLQPKTTAAPSVTEEILPNPLFTKSSSSWVSLEITELVLKLCKGLFSVSPLSSCIPVLLNTCCMLTTPGLTSISRTTCSKLSSWRDLQHVPPTDFPC